MKKIILFLVFLLVETVGFAQGFLVKEFTVDVFLNAEGYFDVVENYEIDFLVPKHGIYREIITDYKFKTAEGKTEKRKLVIENIEVPGHPFTTNFGIEQRTEGKIEIKIGNKSELVTGLQHYEIKYRVYNGFIFEDDLVEFYWNLKPHDWQTVFQKINFKIHAPKGSELSAQNCFIYAGNTGTTTPSTDFDYSYSNDIFSGQSHDFFYSLPGQDVTVLMKLPKNLIKENLITPSPWQQYGWIGILVFLLLVFWFVWLKFGRDEKAILTTSYYPPKDIDPAMAGFLINDKEDTSDLISLFPHWASQGLIAMEEIPKAGLFGKSDMKLTRLGSIPINSPDYQHRIFSGLFNIWGDVVLVSNLRNMFYVTMSTAKKELHAAAQKYYEQDSTKVMNIAIIVAIVLGVLLCVIFLFVFGPVAAIVAPIVCVFIVFMSFYLQKKNSKGNAVFSELKGFKQFIKMAEINRIKELIKQDPQYFEKTMSYALTFGLLEEWAKKFDALDVQPPSWYTSSGTTGMMGIYAFSKSFSGSIAIAGSTMVCSPSSSGSSSSGGGSSGGGFGGGGGGSW